MEPSTAGERMKKKKKDPATDAWMEQTQRCTKSFAGDRKIASHNQGSKDPTFDFDDFDGEIHVLPLQRWKDGWVHFDALSDRDGEIDYLGERSSTLRSFFR